MNAISKVALIFCILRYLWQLPQNLIALLFYTFWGPWKEECTTIKYKNKVVFYFYSPKMSGGMALGEYIFIKSSVFNGTEYTSSMGIQHEFGHVRQSRMLGPLYLIVIGIRSLIHAMIHYKICKKESYYHFWTERWADKLSGIVRK